MAPKLKMVTLNYIKCKPIGSCVFPWIQEVWTTYADGDEVLDWAHQEHPHPFPFFLQSAKMLDP